MVGGLAAIPGNDLSLLAAKDQYPGRELLWPTGGVRLPVRSLGLPWKAAEVLWTLSGGPSNDGYCGGADWVYCPKNDFIPLQTARLAVTVHGAHELDPQMPKAPGLAAVLNRVRRRLSYSRITQRAQLILTVSEFLKAQIIEWFGCDPGKIVVVGNGVEQAFFEAANLTPGVSLRPASRPYLLCVGGLNDLDGAGLMLDVAQQLLRTDPDVLIVVAGQQREPRFVARAKELSNVELLGYVPSAKLALLMRDARALLYLPSYETFGIAAAEAMAVGTPVITTGGTAVPEVVGDVALFAVRNAGDVVEKVRLLIHDDGLAKSLCQAGCRRAVRFSWQACVGRLDTALRSAT
jgi:glycosyltransferase involved in cell wall biosynthesis